MHSKCSLAVRLAYPGPELQHSNTGQRLRCVQNPVSGRALLAFAVQTQRGPSQEQTPNPDPRENTARTEPREERGTPTPETSRTVGWRPAARGGRGAGAAAGGEATAKPRETHAELRAPRNWPT